MLREERKMECLLRQLKKGPEAVVEEEFVRGVLQGHR